MDEGDIPRAGDHYAGIGGAVGIHGTDKPSLNARNVDWTTGCILLENADVAERVTDRADRHTRADRRLAGCGFRGGSSETRYERRVYPAALSLPAP